MSSHLIRFACSLLGVDNLSLGQPLGARYFRDEQARHRAVDSWRSRPTSLDRKPKVGRDIIGSLVIAVGYVDTPA